jgi:mono/diheme cytochrome c family protein
MTALVLLSLALGGCVRGCTSSRPPIHLNPNMDDQPRANALQASDFFYDGKAMRQPIAGTVAREDAVEPGVLETGRENGAGGFAAALPAAAGEHFGQPLALRGAERYGIYCVPCHGAAGDGQGMLFTRSKVTSADLRIARLRAMPDGQLFDVISNGFGLMPSYRGQIPAADRWAIVAYVRQLQAESPVTAPAETGAAPAPGDPAAAPGDAAAPAAAPGGSR